MGLTYIPNIKVLNLVDNFSITINGLKHIPKLTNLYLGNIFFYLTDRHLTDYHPKLITHLTDPSELRNQCRDLIYYEHIE